MLQHESTVRNQIAECRRMAREKGWLVADDCTRSDVGRSGTSVAGRSGLQDLLRLAAAKPRPFDILICDSSCRLSRNLSDAFSIEDTLRRNGIHLCFVSGDLRSPILGSSIHERGVTCWIRGTRALWTSWVSGHVVAYFGRVLAQHYKNCRQA
jgi:DNA invertase Pin-like site-specific DNA recombinase